MISSADSNLQRDSTCASILLIGSTGVGKSATINHLLDNEEGKRVAETDDSLPRTRSTKEFVLSNSRSKKTSKLTLRIIDTPGLNDPRDINQDACNWYSMNRFFETHPLYPKCYPNLVFLLVSANDHRIEGSDSGFANILCGLKELGVVDQHHPNIVVVLTHCCGIPGIKWNENLQKMKDIISRKIREVFGIQPPIVLLENDRDSYDLPKVGDFTLLPNKERQPENLYEACRVVLKDNGDEYGLSTFNECLAKPNAEKPRADVRHEVKANNALTNDVGKPGEEMRDKSESKLPLIEHHSKCWCSRCRNRIWIVVGVLTVVVAVVVVVVVVVFI